MSEKISAVKILGVKEPLKHLPAAKDVTLDKTYDVKYDEEGFPFFIDDAGDQNYGVCSATRIYHVELIYVE